jgi:hypothetical protein
MPRTFASDRRPEIEIAVDTIVRRITEGQTTSAIVKLLNSFAPFLWLCRHGYFYGTN